MRNARLLVLVALSSCAITLAPGAAFAFPSYVNSRYGLAELPGSYTNYECSDCHVNSSGGGGAPCGASSGGQPWAPCFNPFGIQYRTSGWSNALRDGDADGDGISNGAELGDDPSNAPIGSAGFPAGAEAYCNMLTCASSYPSTTTCSGNVRCTPSRANGPASSGTNATSYNYSFSFSCAPGTGPNPVLSDTNWSDRCNNINECAGNPCSPGTCSERSLAGWTSPGYDCSCPAGYSDTGTGCQLVNACAAGTHTCVPGATCVDTPGSSSVYTCTCPHAGYQGDGRNPGSGCTNRNECASNPCAPFGTGGQDGMGCTERPLGAWSSPGYDCACLPGYGSNGTTCTLQNECTAGTADCVLLATCNDPTAAPNDYTCSCPAGYNGNGRASGTGCTDRDECALALDDCDPNATCTNTPGSFTCTCNGPGWVGPGTTCTDYDECLDPVFAATCDANATCNNLIGSFECNCDPGYQGSGLSCTDIDECADGTDDCDANATCSNTPGSWSCACNSGYSGDGRTCTDIDECMDPVLTSSCSTASTCNNLPGDWECVCNTGYRGDGFTCDDIDECAEMTATCHADATCVNELGNYSCDCNPGYRGSGFVCSDENECALGTHGCGANEVCINNLGAPNDCECMPGTTRADAASPCLVTCGDGVVAVGEECDDGNTAADDGCDGRCDIEPGWVCFRPGGGTSVCSNSCGDGLVDAAEECDDGPANSDTTADACRTSCARPSCGDGTTDTGEQCDDGPANTDEGVDGCRTACILSYCGDGVLDTGEVCDPGGGVPGAVVAGTCTTLCAVDAGIDPENPPILTGGACRAAPSGSRSPALVLIALALALLVRRQRS